ncbi:MAG: sugar ABC transporter permease [Spirochaetales bacterium]|nr:sugar ABC transporter permease [Spirochaetales bacterium]
MKKHTIPLLVFVSPALIAFILIMLIPMCITFFYSLTDWNGLNPEYNIVGFQNFIEAVADDYGFRNSIFFTFKYAVVMVVLQNTIALLLALLVNRIKKGKTLLRTALFMPNMISFVIGAFIWSFIFLQVLPTIAKSVYALRFLDQSWLGDSTLAFWSIVIVSLWTGIGYTMIIYLAALQNIPKEIIEQSKIDGANTFKRFIHITLPMIVPAITVCLFITMNGAFKQFDLVYALTNGGPGKSTRVLALDIYLEAFSSNYRYGYANAKAIILFFVVLFLTLVQLKVLKKREIQL